MKTRILIAYILLVLLAAGMSIAPVRAASSFTYAQIGENAVLYSDSELISPLFTLPETYFVAILGEKDGALQVNYMDISGYVAASSVTRVDFEPKTKYAAASSIELNNDGHSVNVRALPDHTADNVTVSLPSGETLFCYGKTTGSEQNALIGGDWYFVRYDESGTIKRGYVYSLYAVFSPPEDCVVEKVATEQTPTNADKSSDSDLPEKVKTATGFSIFEIALICVLCVPVVIIMILLYRAPGRNTR